MKRKFFLRRVGRYFLLMLIPTTLMFTVFFVNAIESEKQSLRRDGQLTLNAVSEYCELTMDSVLSQNEMLSGTTRILLTLRRMLFSSEMSYSDTTIFNTLYATLNSMVNSNSPIDSIEYWLESSPRVLSSSGSGILLLENMEDTAWQEIYAELDTRSRSAVFAHTGEDGRRYVTAVSRMLLTDGCVVVNLDADLWAKEIRSLCYRDGEELLLLNDRGEAVLYAGSGTGALQWTQEELSGLREVQRQTWVRLGGSSYLYDAAETGHLTVVTLVPQSVQFARSKGTMITYLAMLLINLLLVGLISWLATRRTTAQLYRMIDMFEDAMHGRPVEKPADGLKDEYAIIMNNIAYMYLRDVTMQNRVQEETLRKENAELMALQLQINPHFLYNTLQTMDFAILSGNVDRQDISDVFHDLSDILKYALSSPREPVSLGEELKHLRSYADIQRYRFGSKFILYIEIDEGLYPAKVFRMMLQPLVENSMIHGLNGLKDRGHIWVRAGREGDLLHIAVEDSGVGMTAEECAALLERINDPNERSIGLTNLNRRLILSYGEASGLRISSVPQEKTVVSFTIPYRE